MALCYFHIFTVQWALALIGLVLEGVSCFFIPFTGNFFVLMLPICVICFGIALIDTALLPMLGFIVDKKYTAVYGSVYAIADISYCAGTPLYLNITRSQNCKKYWSKYRLCGHCSLLKHNFIPIPTK